MAHKYEITFLEANEADCSAVFTFLIAMYQEVGRMAGDADKAMRSIYLTIQEGVAFNVLRDGEIVGSVGLVKVPDTWYSNLPYFADVWFYTRQDVREADPEVARLIFGEIEGLVNATGTMALFTVFNKRRFVRGRRSTWGQVGERFAIRPAGSVIAIQPGAEHVRHGGID